MKFLEGILNFMAKHYVISAILIVAGALCLSSAIFWGIGALAMEAFNIDYNWTFLHGFVVTLISIALKEIC